MTLLCSFLQRSRDALARPFQRASSPAVGSEGEAGQRGRRPPGRRLLLHADGPGGERIFPQQGWASGHENGWGEVIAEEQQTSFSLL